MTVIDEASPRNGSVVHSHPGPAPDHDATATPSQVGTSRDLQTPARRRRRKKSRAWTRLRSALSPSPPPESESAMAEADAAAKQAEKFFSGWLVVATAISIVANVAHAWLTAPAGIRIGAAIASVVIGNWRY